MEKLGGGEGREEKSHCIYAVDFMCAPLSGGCHFPVNISPFFDFREPASDMRETKRQFGEGNLERREGRLAPYFSAVPVAEGAERERERRWVKDIIIEREETEHMISSEYSIILLIDEKSAQQAGVRILFTHHVEQVSEPFGEQRKLDSKGYEHNHKANIEDKEPLSLCE